ncbi:DUF6273 domain-containing protein [Anaerocolumna sp.]|uniref:DUF6273 domain-containing protein n=1 Tax=Anaerocolumna sp. TaxID=2041569 RepID=UPI0028AF4A4B|nr:DUF6273 domain-containing protein [Anaerocolumna sp.]
MSQKNKDLLEKLVEENNMADETNLKANIESEEAIDAAKEINYQKVMNLMQSIRCMTPYKDKVDMYLEAAKQFDELSDYKDSKELAGECYRLAEATEGEIKEQVYKNATELKEQAKRADEYRLAAEEFRKIDGYLDANTLAKKCEELSTRLEKKAGRRKITNNVVVVLAIIAIFFGVKSAHTKYYLANVLQLTGSYNQAIKVYKRIGGFKDSKEKMTECRYQKGLEAMEEEDYKNAKKAFEAAGDYKDSDQKKVDMEKLFIKNSEIGDTINIGENKWRILEIQDNKALLLKDLAISGMAYNTNSGDVTWEQSTLRNWLNSEFLDENFTKAEKDNIILATVKNSDNPVYGTSGGNDTQDYIYLFSIEEIEQYNELIPDLKSNSWLRSPGNQQGSAAFLSVNRLAMKYGYEATSEEFRVKPVMWFNLD